MLSSPWPKMMSGVRASSMRMDEIEAALDEANVTRYAEYMRRMSDKTQFLVITHRRGTMEEADMLYGVTMQEKGVSTVIELDLENAQKTIEE